MWQQQLDAVFFVSIVLPEAAPGTVRKTGTKKTPRWAQTTDGIVQRWEEYPDNPRALSALRLDDRLQRLFVMACCRSVAMWVNRDFGAVPILADALQDAGADNAEWLARVRDPEWPWCRGCHVLDSLLPELVHRVA